MWWRRSFIIGIIVMFRSIFHSIPSTNRSHRDHAKNALDNRKSCCADAKIRHVYNKRISIGDVFGNNSLAYCLNALTSISFLFLYHFPCSQLPPYNICEHNCWTSFASWLPISRNQDRHYELGQYVLVPFFRSLPYKCIHWIYIDLNESSSRSLYHKPLIEDNENCQSEMNRALISRVEERLFKIEIEIKLSNKSDILPPFYWRQMSTFNYLLWIWGLRNMEEIRLYMEEMGRAYLSSPRINLIMEKSLALMQESQTSYPCAWLYILV